MGTEHTAVVVPYTFAPPKNGGQKAAFGICKALSEVKKTTAISTPNNEVGMASFSIEPLLNLSQFRYFNLLSIFPLYHFLKREKVDHVIAFQPFILFLLYLPTLLTGARLSVYIQNIEYQRFKSMGKWWWPVVFVAEWLAFKLAGHLYFISPDEINPGQQIFMLSPDKCSVLPYGVPWTASPERLIDRQRIRQVYGYAEESFLIVFFGPLKYQPNLEALEKIINHIEPALRKIATFPYRFLICGGGLPEHYNNLKNFENIDYLGFVEDIEAIVKASDLMVNPITSGGGVKTKLVEAIGLGTTVVSSITGALGVVPEACGKKLIRVPDNDFPAYAEAIKTQQSAAQASTPNLFYETYSWENIIKNI